MIHRSLAICVLGLAVAFALSSELHASSLPPEYSLRMSVAISDLIFVGRLVLHEEYAPTDEFRYSRIVVNQPLYGAADVGDTVRVRWRQETYATADGRAAISTSVRSPLPNLDGQPKLWLARGWDYVRLVSDPIHLGPHRRNRLAEMLSWIEEPRIPEDHLYQILRRDDAEEVLGAPEFEVIQKLDLVAEFFRSEVDSIAAWRSN